MQHQSQSGSLPPTQSERALPSRPAIIDLGTLADDLPSAPATPLEQLAADHPDVQQWVAGGRDKSVIGGAAEELGVVPSPAPLATEADHTFPVPGTFVGPRESWVEPERLDGANTKPQHNTGA